MSSFVFQKVDEIRKTNEDMQEQINRLHTEFDSVLGHSEVRKLFHNHVQGCALRKFSGSPLGSQPCQQGRPALQVGRPK